MHSSYTTEKITQQRMAETARRARIYADRDAHIPRRPRRTIVFPRITFRRKAVRIA
jgi:hypothetical protein